MLIFLLKLLKSYTFITLLLLAFFFISCNSQKLQEIERLISNQQLDQADEKITNLLTTIGEDNYKDLARLYYLEGDLYAHKFDYNNGITSLQKALYYCKKSNDDLLLADCYDLLSHCYFRYKQIDKSKAIADTLIGLALQQNNTLAEGRGLSRLAICLVTMGEDSAAIKIAEKALRIAHLLQDHNTIGGANLAIGVAYYLKENRKKALEYDYKALEAYKKAANSFGIAQVNLNIGSCLEENRDYTAALNAYKEGIQYAMSINSKDQLMKLYHNIGVVYIDMNKTNDAIYSLEQSQKYNQDNKDPLFKYRNLKMLSSIFLKQKRYTKVIEVMKEAQQIDTNSTLKKSEYVHVYLEIGKAYLALNDYEQAQVNYKEAYKMAVENKDTIQIHVVNTNISDLLIKTNKHAEAQKLCQDILDYSEKNANEELFKYACNCLYNTHKKLGSPQQALTFYEKHTAIQDSLLNESKLFEIGKMQAQIDYQQDKIDAQNRISSLNNELTIKKQRGNYIIIIAAMLLLFSSILFYAYLKIKNSQKTLLLLNDTISQKNALVEQQNKELEKSNEKIIKQNEQLAQSNHNLLNFANMAAHDMKAPLRTIKSFTDIINKKYRSLVKENDHELFDFVINSCQDLTNLIQVLLQFSKTTENLPKAVAIDLNATVKNVLHKLKVNIDESQTDLQIINSLPTVEAHESLMQQLFLNFIGNSIKYRKENIQNVVTIDIGKTQDDYVCIIIKDNGIGIPQHIQPKIFGLFSKYHTSSQHEGYGIGLSTCKKIIDYYGGKIWVESETNKGSAFYFTLKLFLQNPIT